MAESNAPSETTVKLQRLHDVTRRMMEAEHKQELFRTVTEAASDLLGFEFNTVRRYDQENEQLVPVAVSPELRDQTGQREAYDRGNTVQWQAIDEKELLVFQSVSDIDDDVERSGDGSMMVVPLAEYGVLTMGAPEPQIIEERDIELARVFAANIETAIDRVERLETLRKREAELEKKNERLERFASKLSHELRNPLNVIAGRIDLARETGDPEHFEDLEQAIGRMNRLIDDLLSFTRADDIEMTPDWIDIGILAESSWRGIRSPGTELQIETEIAVYADEDRLYQMIDNLLRNAVEHGSPPQADDDETVEDVTVTIGDLSDGFFIEDDGRGIPEEQHDRVLSEGGTELPHWTGLGLRIVSEAADAHDWSMELTESEDGGARFEFRGAEIRTENQHE